MPDLFTADEVFQVALEIEETGHVFYEAMAAAASSEPISRTCRRLALDEDEHYRAFAAMRTELRRRQDARAMTPEEAEFVQGTINSLVIPDPREAIRVARQNSLGKLLDVAFQMENDSVRFYSGIVRMLPPGDAKAVARIIEQEKRHAHDIALARRNLH